MKGTGGGSFRITISMMRCWMRMVRGRGVGSRCIRGRMVGSGVMGDVVRCGVWVGGLSISL